MLVMQLSIMKSGAPASAAGKGQVVINHADKGSSVTIRQLGRGP